MGKKLAHKKTKQLIEEKDIKEKNMNIGEFSPRWQGRLFILDETKSAIAQKIGIAMKGEFAIKVR